MRYKDLKPPVHRANTGSPYGGEAPRRSINGGNTGEAVEISRNWLIWRWECAGGG